MRSSGLGTKTLRVEASSANLKDRSGELWYPGVLCSVSFLSRSRGGAGGAAGPNLSLYVPGPNHGSGICPARLV